jgi:sialidase-1
MRGVYHLMPVSLPRLENDHIALCYPRKNSLKDRRPIIRIPIDETETWGKAVEVITDQVGYHVLNNDRVIQLKGRRLICPVALHHLPE